ncbi:CarD family transcriptional regulator [Rhodococcus chondri]|uniref:CarD family transcriptional regulator n=1 Tax=Rhodococcus chondri TaxID=3065941 RepID=A0ABU7JLR5_9NOCA|nr:CarD family transcriptional regulator [Rhodococcus sp. CC-R104]MEE2030981.1 CarD family transcriptional regulator [Rhodococcus sp. CC-R104]
MQFSAGQIIVHPHHGPTTVTDVTSRIIKGASVTYLGLRVHKTDMTVHVPFDRAEELGLRKVYDTDELAELFDVLRAPTGHEEEAWSRRFKDNQEKIKLGDLLVTAGVVRDLTRRERDRGLSTGEKNMLRTARLPVATELALALEVSDEKAEGLIDAAILDPESHRDREQTAVG